MDWKPPRPLTDEEYATIASRLDDEPRVVTKLIEALKLSQKEGNDPPDQ